ncbi:MAG: GNAT family N-acetyltransferase [Anaerolineae bacterium]|nr:GNAT family N-acetyltransferase [Anaerolineae bacterium]
MSGIHIRPATSDDVEALCRLYYELHECHVRGVPDQLVSLGAFDERDWSDLVAALERLIGDDSAALLVATQDSAVVGLVEAYFRTDAPSPARRARSHAYVQSLVVTETVRGRGVGRALMAAAHTWAVTRGAAEIELDIWEYSGGPLAFYESLGYRTLRRTLVHDLV